MNDLKSSNWSDIQCFNFICGLIRVPTASSPTPYIPDIDQVLLYIFPPEFYDYTTGKSLSASQIVIRVYDANNVYTDYLISLQDFTIQESTLLTGINAQKPIFDYGTAEQIFLDKQGTLYIKSIADNISFTTLATYNTVNVAKYTSAIRIGQDLFVLSKVPAINRSREFEVVYGNSLFSSAVNYLIVDNDERVVRALSTCGNKTVVWVYGSGDNPSHFEGYVLENICLTFADADVSAASALYISGEFVGEEFVVDILTMYDKDNLSANTFAYNNSKLAIISNTYFYNNSAAVDAGIKFAVAQRSSKAIECQYGYQTNRFNVLDGIDPNVTFVDKSNTRFVLASNQVALYMFKADSNNTGHCLYLLDIDTGALTLQNTTLNNGMWAGAYSTYSFFPDTAVATDPSKVLTIAEYRSTSSSLRRFRVVEYYPASVGTSSITSVKDLPGLTVGQYAFSLFKAGSAYFYGYRNSNHEIYQTYAYYGVYNSTSFNLYVYYNNVRYGVYKVTQCNDDLVLWIHCAEGIVGLEFADITSTSSLRLSGTFTGYKYVIETNGFVRNIKTFRNVNRLALWSYQYYDTQFYTTNYTATHIIRPELTQDTASISV